MSEHLVEVAKALVRVRDGKVEVLTDPGIQYCPLRGDLYRYRVESQSTVEESILKNIRELGMYSPERVLELNCKPVSFGASEILSDAMSEGLIDAAVVACEGVGTVIIPRPNVLQAVGAHMTGLICTEPISEIQDGLESRDCILIDRECTIDQVKGYRRAVQAGFNKIAVTVAGTRACDAKELRGLGKSLESSLAILAVHTTGVSLEESEMLAENCDMVWACASKSVREVVGRQSKIQIGISIPVFALTDLGKRLILNRMQHFEGRLAVFRSNLPYAPEGKQPEPLI